MDNVATTNAELIENLKRYKLVIILFVLLIIALSVGFFWINPKYAVANKMNQDIKKYEEIIVKRKSHSEDLGLMKNQNVLLERTLDKTKAMFFSENQATTFIVTQMPEIANKYKVNVENIQIKPIEKVNEAISKVPVSIAVKGDYFSVRNFIMEWEYNSKAMTVDDFVLTAYPGEIVQTSIVINILILEKTK